MSWCTLLICGDDAWHQQEFMFVATILLLIPLVLFVQWDERE